MGQELTHRNQLHLKSLGTHEHWNNETDMKYSRDLGTGAGIELVRLLTYTDIESEVGLPTAFNLKQNYPNPFNPVTTIRYSIPSNVKVILNVFDVAGREVAILENRERVAGNYQVNFDAKQLASGVYYYRLNAGSFTSTKKFVLIK
jgi:hypothetical protein